MHPGELLDEVGAMAVNVAVTAQRRGQVSVAGPLNLVFDDLASNTPEQLNFTVAFPVDGTPVPQAGYQTRQVPEQQVLSLDFDRTQHSVESAWRALYSAAYTQGLKPAQSGYVVIDNRGVRRVSYQLVVTDQYTE